MKSDRYLTAQDLLVDPVTFKNGIYELLRDYIAYYRELDEDYDNWVIDSITKYRTTS